MGDTIYTQKSKCFPRISANLPSYLIVQNQITWLFLSAFPTSTEEVSKGEIHQEC